MARSAKPRKQKSRKQSTCSAPCCDGGWSPAPEEQIMKPGCFFPTSPALPITVWRKLFHTCLKKMPPEIMKQLYGVSLNIENYCTIRASPACQSRFFRFLSARQ